MKATTMAGLAIGFCIAWGSVLFLMGDGIGAVVSWVCAAFLAGILIAVGVLEER